MPEGAASYRYWPDGLEKGRSLPNGLEEARCYDAAGRLTALATAHGAIAADCTTSALVVSRFEYGYDANGNRARQLERRTDPATQALGAAEETLYGYDALDRLVGVLYPGGEAVLYRLDGVGNRIGERELTGQAPGIDLTSFETPGAGALARDVTATFNRADWLLRLADVKDVSGEVSFGWDLAGNLVSKEKEGLSRELRWDGRNALVAVIDNGAVVGSFDYDHAGLRVKRQTATEQVEYVLDDKYVLQEARGDYSLHPSYRRYHYGYGPLAVVDSGASRFISTDALGSTTDLTTATGTVASGHQYDAWGQYRNGTAPSASEPKLGFTGHQFDPETGLVYARARYYDAELGVFLSRDALDRGPLDAPNLHRFTWARGNPLRFLDPSGYAEEETQPPPAPTPPQMVTEQDEASACFSDSNSCPQEQAALKKALEAAEKKRAAREKFFRDRDASCTRDPTQKMCHSEAVTTVEEDTEGNGTFKENDDPGVRDFYQGREHFKAGVRKVGEYGLVIGEAAASSMPVAGTMYELKRAKGEASQGEIRQALMRAGIVLGPHLVGVLVKVGGKAFIRIIRAEAAEAKLVGREAAAVEKMAAAEGPAIERTAGSIRKVNPTGSRTNCVNCAIATDATLAGSPASALPSGPTPIAVLEKMFGGQFTKMSGQAAVEAELLKAGPGARAIVFGSRGPGQVGHVFNVVNQGGTIRFLDGQTGKAATFQGYVELYLLPTR
jgi:RHS repeat-associated protein